MKITKMRGYSVQRADALGDEVCEGPTVHAGAQVLREE